MAIDAALAALLTESVRASAERLGGDLPSVLAQCAHALQPGEPPAALASEGDVHQQLVLVLRLPALPAGAWRRWLASSRAFENVR